MVQSERSVTLPQGSGLSLCSALETHVDDLGMTLDAELGITPSFIESPFPTRREYEAWLRLPPAERAESLKQAGHSIAWHTRQTRSIAQHSMVC